MKISDIKRLFSGLNRDDNPAFLKDGEYVDGLNIRTVSSEDEQESGIAETLRGEVEVLINVNADLQYYGQAIGGEFQYSGYEEVTIGSQVWMKNNWDADYPGSKVYNDTEANRAIYGGLYTWDQVMASDFAPDGWRVPTEADVDALLTYLGGALIAGGKMKEPALDHWLTPNTGADDSSGFKGLGGGKYDSAFDLLQEMGLFWLQDEAEPLPPVAIAETGLAYVLFTANWEASAGALGYYLDVATDAAFTAMVAGFNNLDVGNVLSKGVIGLTSGIIYYYRIRAYNEIGTSIDSNTMTCKTLEDFNDWFMPSKDELLAMYNELYLHGLGDFLYAYYFSSSEQNANNAWAIIINTGLFGAFSKGSSSVTRPCREFVSLTPYSLRDIGPAGGLIFYKNGATYLEAALLDVAVLPTWSNIENIAIGTTGTAIGTGQANTTDIIGQVGHIASSAKQCDDLIITY